MSIDSFFCQYPLFRVDQLAVYKAEQGVIKPEHVQQTLQYYLRKGRIISIRRGLFAVVPPNQSDEELHIDPYALAGTVADDSVLSYHTALELHGFAYSLFQRQTFKTCHKVKPFRYGEILFQPVVHKAFIRNPPLYDEFTMVVNRNGTDIRMTNFASTYVDVLDRPDLCGGWEEVHRSLGVITTLPIRDVIRYCLALGSPVLSAKVGYFLEQRTGVFATISEDLEKLIIQRPKSPYYLVGRSQEPCQYIKKWNLMVPESHINNEWEEPTHDL